ncbi:TRM112-like protein [Apostasia shenzhenica]|uniref:TRM112-like protein n=1 Tax=Apostasia shenzhenica TaxID=1088818 RepID=A0A2I0A1Y7_9ASPA|nr:TRM112-like protein [Apostasia shenzhenica]
MRLLTHNMLACNIKGVTNGYPLGLEAEKWVEKEVDFNADFLRGVFPKIEWRALVGAARALGFPDLLPEDAPDPSVLSSSDDFLRRFHRALLELHVEEGALVCPETGRRFPISKGIPNMLLHEDEV